MTTLDGGHLADRLDAYVDGELDVVAARDAAAHLATCAVCRRRVDDRRALVAAVRDSLPTFRAPDVLRASLGARPKQRRVWGGVGGKGALAAAAALVVVAWGSGYLWGVRSGRSVDLRDAVVSSHIRSLLPDHLIDVASSDQHTVKPWFTGRLDFSPTVVDLSAQGFPLIGGRLDYVGGRRVPALAYGRGKHVINVFEWPAAGGDVSLSVSETRGYHVMRWVHAGMEYWAISDVNEADLRQFVGLVQDATRT